MTHPIWGLGDLGLRYTVTVMKEGDKLTKWNKDKGDEDSDEANNSQGREEVMKDANENENKRKWKWSKTGIKDENDYGYAVKKTRWMLHVTHWGREDGGKTKESWRLNLDKQIRILSVWISIWELMFKKSIF